MLIFAASVTVFVAYLSFLVLVAYRVERQTGWLATLPSKRWVYALSLTVFFTGWSYFSAGSSLLDLGMPFVAIQIGASLTLLFGWPILKRAVRIAKLHRVTTLPGLLSVRFGASRMLTGLVAVLLVVGTLPYIALQIGALGFALENVVTSPSVLELQEGRGVVLTLTLLLALFAIAFGVRRADPTHRNAGMTVTLAIDGLVKLAAVIAVSCFALWKQPELFAMLSAPDIWPHLLLESTPRNSYATWLGYLLISMGAVAVLPHMYHLIVVESADENQVADVRGALPLYGWLTYLMVILIAIAGLARGLEGPQNQASILLIPMAANQPILELLAYLGGVAAAAGITIAAFVALTNLITADLVLPVLSRLTTRLGPALLPLRWLILLAVAGMSFGVWLLTDVTFLSQFGLVSFIAAAQLAPALFLGMTWAKLSRGAVLWGLVLAVPTWLYTALLPSFAGKFTVLARWVADGPFGWNLLRPYSLFGLTGMDPYVHSFFWSMALNLMAIVLVSLFKPSTRAEVEQAEALLQGKPTYPLLYHRFLKTLSYPEMEAVLVKYLGEEQAQEQMERIRVDLSRMDVPQESKLLAARNAIQRALSGPLGPSVACDIVQREFPVSESAVPDAMEAYQKLELMLETSREDLASRLRELSLLNALSERLVVARDQHHVLETGTGLLWDMLHFERVGALMVEQGQSRLCCLKGFQHLTEGPFSVPEDSSLADALRRRQIYVVTEGRSQDPILSLEGARTLFYVPIVSEQSSVGVLICGMTSSPLALSPSLRNVLQSIANELAISLSEARHREKEELLRQQLETTLANLADGVIVFDPQRKIRLVNPAFRRLAFVPAAEDLQGADLLTIFQWLDPKDLSGQRLALEKLPSIQALGGKTAHLTARVGGHEEGERILSITSVPVLDAADRVVQVVSVYRDITELYHLTEDLERRVQDRTDELAQERDRLMLSNQKLEKALEDLRNLDQLKGTFVNAISHDLRIPLTGITGYAEFLEDEIGGPLTEQQQVYAREIQLAAARMTRLLNDLLDYARIEAGKLTVELRTIELTELLRGAVATFLPAAEKKGLRLVLDLQPAIPAVWADADRVLQIVSNLLSNAIKFTPAGGEVRVRALSEDAVVAIEVSDTGPGIPPEVLPHLFERFFQTEAGIKAGGTGLGLSVSKSLVEAQGGTMSVESKPGEKTTFRFTLPKAVSE